MKRNGIAFSVRAAAAAWAFASGALAAAPAAETAVLRLSEPMVCQVVQRDERNQGLIPVKLLGLEHGVNTTLGLPLVRTSPDHGTAFDLAGTGRASPESLLSAMDAAIEMTTLQRIQVG